MLEYQNIKIVLRKVYTPNWSEEDFVIKRINKHCTMGSTILNKRT